MMQCKALDMRAGTRWACGQSSSGPARALRALRALLGPTGILACVAAVAQPAPDLTRLSLDELLKVDITTVFKKPSRAFDTPAAVHVISNDDIRRSGVTSIPEALRLAPGLHVARIDANKWAISARGFNDRFAEKLLVLIDGRSVYTPMFNGVYWDAQDTLLEDVERIEVFLGPGGTSWGANAVNGVINIITKSAGDTKGGYVEAFAGSEERASVAARYGARIGEVDTRAYVKGRKINDLELSGGVSAEDNWSLAQGGFRADWAGGDTRVTAQGDYFDADKEATGSVPSFDAPFLRPITRDYDVSGGNVLLRVEQSGAGGEELSLQGYYDFSDRKDPFTIGLDRHTVDLEIEHRFPFGERQEINYGFNYRRVNFSANAPESIQALPSIDHLNLFSAFIQDQIRMFDDRVSLTIGTKVEHNTVSDLEVMPSARAAWRPTDRQTYWAAVSRAVRVPGISEFDGPQVVFPVVTFREVAPGVTLPVFIEGSSVGTDDAEDLTAVEGGARVQLSDALSVDLALYYFHYSDLSIGVQGAPRFNGCTALQTPFADCLPTGIVVPISASPVAQSATEAESYGFELSANWRVSPTWRVKGWYAFQNDRVDAPVNTLPRSRSGTSPRHQAMIRSSHELAHNVELDIWGRYVDQLRAHGVPGYATASLRLAWRPTKRVELSLVGHNLLQSRHTESAGNVFIGGDPSEMERSMYLKASFRF